VFGCTQPRLWTPPLRELTPETSVGFDVIDFARYQLAFPLDPWEEWAVIHGGELLPDGRPRFRVVHVVVARQNGKTTIPVVLSLYWQVIEQVAMILGTSTKIDYAKESWFKAVTLAEKAPGLADLVPSHLSLGPDGNRARRLWLRQANGEQESTLCGSRYKIAAANEEGGRSLTVHRLVLDELRQHHDYSAWDAAVPAGNAVADFQAWCLSNAGTSRSVVFNDERETALKFIETGEGDPRTGWFEWSSEPGADPMSLAALAQANPNLGRRIDVDTLLGQARKAVEKGGEKLAGFRTECMCISVGTLTPVIDPEVWASRADPGSQVVGRLALGFEVALDRSAASISVSGRREDGRVHCEVIDRRGGMGWVIPRLVELCVRWGPVMIGLDPSSPAGALVPDLSRAIDDAVKARRLQDPVATFELTNRDMATAFSGFVADVVEDRLRHRGEQILVDELGTAVARPVGDGGTAWGRRRSGGDISALVAVTVARWTFLQQVPEPDEVWGFSE